MISEVRVLTFRYPKNLNTFGALTSIPKSEGASGCGWGHQTSCKFSKFSGTERIRVFTSMHQMYSKFSGTDKIRVSAFHVIRTRNLSIPESWILWHLCKRLNNKMIFQQDGAPCPHFSKEVRAWLNEKFNERWIGQGGPIYWASYSPDLTPLDFFLWRYIKTKVNDTANLKEKIEQGIKAIKNETLENVFDGIVKDSKFLLMWMMTLSSSRCRNF